MNKLKIFNKKKVLVTGHTGFKGSWLTICLKMLGARVLGVSKDFPTAPLHFSVCKDLKNINTKKLDIVKFKKIKKVINDYKPDFIFHLAAQPIVKRSVNNPIETWNSNTIGTLNILETLRFYKKKVNVVIITSDKVYFNFEKKGAYKESDVLGGKDPYSASKASAEIAIRSYFETYLSERNNLRIAVARAGNVIGGGDWSDNRLIPDCVRAWSKNKSVKLRNPLSTRPWQHVIEVVYGYMLLASELSKKKKLNGQAFNFGPYSQTDYKVIDCLKEMKKNWPKIKWNKLDNSKIFKEAGLLKLNSEKSYKHFKWRTILDFKQTIKMTAEWYKNFYDKKSKVITLNQIKFYFKKVEGN